LLELLPLQVLGHFAEELTIIGLLDDAPEPPVPHLVHLNKPEYVGWG
jgi:hypothetical protein